MTFYERILLEIRERIHIYAENICAGRLELVEYKSMTGRMNGLKEAENIILKAYKDCFEKSFQE